MQKIGSFYTKMKNEKEKKKNQATFTKEVAGFLAGYVTFLIS